MHRYVVAFALVLASCGTSDQTIDAGFGAASPSPTSEVPSTIVFSPVETDVPVTSPSTSTTTSTVTATSTTTTSTTTSSVPVAVQPIPASADDLPPLADPWLSRTNEAFESLARNNVGASVSVSRGGTLIFGRASGTTVGGAPATSDTPMVVASVSKLVVAMAIARLDQRGAIDVDGPVPWAEIGILANPGWADVTLRELLHHTSGFPEARSSWFTPGADCRGHAQSLVANGPLASRGERTYSNGNYCLLGLVVEATTGEALDVAAQRLVFDPVGVDGIHLSGDALLADDMPHPHGAGVARLSRLGGAGTLVVSTDDLAIAVGRLLPADLDVVRFPAVFTDQYGFGHTGTIDGAKSCVWVIEAGRTVVSATIAGNALGTGGAVCDAVLPAVARDLGTSGDGRPTREP